MPVRALPRLAAAVTALLLLASCSTSGSSDAAAPTTAAPATTEGKTTEPRGSTPDRDTEVVEEDEEDLEEHDAEWPDTSGVTPGELLTVGTVQVPAAESGKVSVVWTGDTQGDFMQIPVLIRNGTDEPIFDLRITLAAKGPDGAFLGSGDGYFTNPAMIAPGGWGFSEVTFDQELPDGATFDAVVEVGDELSYLSTIDLTVDEAKPGKDDYDDAAIVGLATNTNSLAVTDSIDIAVACFDASGSTLLSVENDWAEVDGLEVGDSAEWTVSLWDGEDSCPNYAVSVTGRII